GRNAAAGAGAAGLGAGALHEYDKHTGQQQQEGPDVGAAQTGGHGDGFVQSGYERTRYGGQGSTEIQPPRPDVGAAQTGSHEDEFVQSGYDRTRHGGEGTTEIKQPHPDVGAAQTGSHGDGFVQSGYDRTRHGGQGTTEIQQGLGQLNLGGAGGRAKQDTFGSSYDKPGSQQGGLQEFQGQVQGEGYQGSGKELPRTPAGTNQSGTDENLIGPGANAPQGPGSSVY
ncbi:hypothetical protein SERLA73DRAFT_175759, partial [Serpula lacrymans var. lacrymans S7.3]